MGIPLILLDGHELGNIIPHGDGGAACGLSKVAALVAGFLPCAHDTAGGVDDGTVTVLVKGELDIGGGTALSTVAGHQEEGLAQALAQSLDVGGVGSTGNGAARLMGGDGDGIGFQSVAVYARQAGLTAYALNCKTNPGTFPTYWLRELFAIVKMYMVLIAD